MAPDYIYEGLVCLFKSRNLSIQINKQNRNVKNSMLGKPHEKAKFLKFVHFLFKKPKLLV